MATTQKRMRAKSIGHYILGKTIGEGTFGKVKVGNHILTGEKVAVKILEKERIVDVADVGRVAREIHILKLIQHPHVIRLFEIIETPRQLYLIMEYCSGGELFDLIVASGRVQEPEACRFFQQIIAGVEQIHRRNVVHRDLKPENLLLDENKNIKIVDFGLSNTYQDDQLLKTACGSPCYAPPEMIAGHQYVPSCCDMWSCGVILFALVCGYLPFEDQNTAELYKKILAGDYHPPNFISDAVRDLIGRLLTVDPEQRITVEQVRAHPWFLQVPDAARAPLSTATELQEDLIEHLERFGFLREYVVKCLQMNKHNHVTTTYHLLAEKKRRMEGSLSRADVAYAAFGKLSPGASHDYASAMEPADADRAGGTSPPYVPAGKQSGDVAAKRSAVRQTSVEAPTSARTVQSPRYQQRSPSHTTPQKKPTSSTQATVTPPSHSVASARPVSGGSQSARGPSTVGSRVGGMPSVRGAAGVPARPSGYMSARTSNDVRRRQYSAAGDAPQSSNPSSARGLRSPTGYGSADSTRSGGVARPTTGSSPTPAWSPRTQSGSVHVQASLISPRTSTTQDAESANCSLPPSAEPPRDEIRSCRGAFNVSCTSSRSPRMILQEIQRACAVQRVAAKQASPYVVRCQKQSLRFEMEIANLDQLESIHVVRFRRLAGETGIFKELCAKIIAEMKI
mmetsp:Transcript_21913/g.51218  ORF Transcript_21913/g.51218 Transcript_21913/m.51218 type:complete len:680 (+) Transcript_21913:59-2098(+)